MPGKRIGETFPQELAAAGLADKVNSFVIGGTEEQIEAPRLTAAQRVQLEAVIAAHDPTKRPVPSIPLAVLQSRLEAETVGGVDGWTKYAEYMRASVARQTAFQKIMFAGAPIPQDHAGFRSTLQSAGFSATQIDRILANPS